MIPCQLKRVGWAIKSGDEAASIKNVKVMEVIFRDGTVWESAK